MGKKIAIIDSGVYTKHKDFIGKRINGFSLFVNDDGKVIRDDSFEDTNGHGTAVFSIISNEIDFDNITNIKIFDDEKDLLQEDLELILEYISENYHFDVINLSLGIICCNPTERIQSIINRMRKTGCLLVSAFDNTGGASIPAMLDGVIGVDGDEDIEKGKYVEIKGSIVNIVGKTTYLKVAWINPCNILVKGNSFLAAQITALIANIEERDQQKIISLLCDSSIEVEKQKTVQIPFKINRASVFPFNKEVYAIARFENLVPFDIVDYYSLRIMGCVDRKVCDLVKGSESEKVIKDISTIDWDSFDTLIIGHTDACTKLTHIDIKKKLIDEANKNNKNIYSFDREYMNLVPANRGFWPQIDENYIEKRFGKLYHNNVPILAIVGTNSKQGKFTLQLMLRERLKKIGYNVGQIGTEPTSLLFGMDEMVACGYNSSIELKPEQIYMYMNQVVHNVVEKDVDIILFGAQTALLGYNINNVFQIPLEQRVVFEAVKSDGIILCIDSFDDEDYVRQTIKLAEGLSGGKIIALACYPIKQEKGLYGKAKLLDNKEREDLKKSFFDIPLIWTDNNIEVDRLVEICINYFSE